MILGKQKRGVTTRWDLLLAEAEYRLEMERCPQCGQPRYICNNTDPDIGFDIRIEECHATQARTRAEKSREKQKKDSTGIQLGADPFTYSQTPLDEFREPFYVDQMAKAAEKVATRPVIPRSEPL